MVFLTLNAMGFLHLLSKSLQLQLKVQLPWLEPQQLTKNMMDCELNGISSIEIHIFPICDLNSAHD